MHVITSLGLGGTETVLLRLLERTTSTCEVVVLQRTGIVGDAIERLGVPVRSLGLHSRVPTPRSLWTLARWARAFRPDVVQTWLYAADLAGGVAGLATGAPVLWNLRNTMIDSPGLSFGTRAVIRLAAATARIIPARIVCGSEAAAVAHVRAGYPAARIVVIPNGIDIAQFRPDEQHREAVRAELRLPSDAVVIALIGRFDPLKDHRNFIDAAARVSRHAPNAAFVLAGDGISSDNDMLMSWIRDAGIGNVTHLLGRRMDVARIMAATDVAVLSSRSEGFPNVVAEAMACGVPCVVTDVGDAAEIIGDTGIVVPPRDAQALADGCLRLIDAGPEVRRQSGERARNHIAERYSLDAMVERYDSLHAELARVRSNQA